MQQERRQADVWGDGSAYLDLFDTASENRRAAPSLVKRVVDRQRKMPLGRYRLTNQLGASTISLMRRSAATLHNR